LRLLVERIDFHDDRVDIVVNATSLLASEPRRAKDLLLASEGDALNAVAASAGHSRKHFSRLVRLAYLAPDIVSRILDGKQPAAPTRLKMLIATDILLD
jgi:site-specific DNA recombinase